MPCPKLSPPVAKTGAAGKVLIVSTVERKPFIFYHQKGKVTGFSADLWTEIALRNSWRFNWKRETGFQDMVDAVEGGKSDAAIANISITLDREKMHGFFPFHL